MGRHAVVDGMERIDCLLSAVCIVYLLHHEETGKSCEINICCRYNRKSSLETQAGFFNEICFEHKAGILSVLLLGVFLLYFAREGSVYYGYRSVLTASINRIPIVIVRH